MTSSCLFLINKLPESELILTETLDALLTFSAFDLEVSVLLLDDGVNLINAIPCHIACESMFSRFMETLDFYGIEPVWVESESLVSRDISLSPVSHRLRLLARQELPVWLRQYTVVLGL